MWFTDVEFVGMINLFGASSFSDVVDLHTLSTHSTAADVLYPLFCSLVAVGEFSLGSFAGDKRKSKKMRNSCLKTERIK